MERRWGEIRQRWVSRGRIFLWDKARRIFVFSWEKERRGRCSSARARPVVHMI
jgi:hypothetical protein